MNSRRLLTFLLVSFSFFSFLTTAAVAQEKPDFQIDRFHYSSSGDNFFVTIKNNNSNAHFEGRVSFGLWLNNNLMAKRYRMLDFKTIDVNDILLFQSKEFMNKVNMSGSVMVKVKVDYYNDYAETTETNNIYSQSFTFNTAATAVHDLSLHSIYKAGQDKIHYVVKNSSSNPFTGSVTIGWSVNEKTKPVMAFILNNLHPGYVKDVQLPYTLQPGRNAIQVKVDPYNKIHETNENNNHKLEYFYPNIAEIELMTYARLGWQGKSRIINQNTNPALITPDTIGPVTSAVNRGMNIEVNLRGLGSSAVSSYKITIYCYVPGNTLRTFMPKTFSVSPVNGEIKKHNITFWVPKNAAAANQSGKLVVYLQYTKNKSWTIPFKFSGF